MEYLFYRYGWDAPVDDTLFEKINQVISIKKLLEECIQLADTLQDKLDSDQDAFLTTAEILTLAESVQKLYGELSSFSLSDFSTLPEPLNEDDFWSDFGEQLLDDLQETYLRVLF